MALKSWKGNDLIAGWAMNNVSVTLVSSLMLLIVATTSRGSMPISRETRISNSWLLKLRDLLYGHGDSGGERAAVWLWPGAD
jgi:hypothetical protein